ncbi:MAG: TolC family protein, partial [Treponema sp.]|nr:TolC family protein [Treponema sp.]
MTKKNLPAMVLSLIFFSAAAAAGGITLEQAVETAIANNGDLQKTASAFQQAKRAKDYGWNQILSLPSAFQVGVSNTHQIFGDSGSSAAGTGGSAGGSNWPLGGQLTLGARFQFSTDTRGQLRQVDLAYRRAGEAYEKAVRDLSGDVAASFYSLLASRLNIAILETDLELKNAQYEQENANYRRGLASELDMLNAQYAYLSAGPALTAAVSKYGEDLAAFFLLLGLDAG